MKRFLILFSCLLLLPCSLLLADDPAQAGGEDAVRAALQKTCKATSYTFRVETTRAGFGRNNGGGGRGGAPEPVIGTYADGTLVVKAGPAEMVQTPDHTLINVGGEWKTREEVEAERGEGRGPGRGGAEGGAEGGRRRGGGEGGAEGGRPRGGAEGEPGQGGGERRGRGSWGSFRLLRTRAPHAELDELSRGMKELKPVEDHYAAALDGATASALLGGMMRDSDAVVQGSIQIWIGEDGLLSKYIVTTEATVNRREEEVQISTIRTVSLSDYGKTTVEIPEGALAKLKELSNPPEEKDGEGGDSDGVF